MGRPSGRNNGTSAPRGVGKGRVAVPGLADAALRSAAAMEQAGRLSRHDRLAYAWGWAEGFRAARRALRAGQGVG
jgi:hypothetical protein